MKKLTFEEVMRYLDKESKNIEQMDGNHSFMLGMLTEMFIEAMESDADRNRIMQQIRP